MASVVYQCRGCGFSIEPSAQVTRMVKDTPTRDGGSVDPTGIRRDEAFAHEGHEAWYVARGYRAVERGVLTDLIARK